VEELLKYLSVYALSGFKFIFGPTLGAAYEFHWLLSGLLTALGMMTAVYIFTYSSGILKRFTKKFRKKDRKVFSKKSRRYVKVWRKYGVKGIAFLTPLILMPWGGAILANVLGGKRHEIIFWMWISALFWGLVISLVVDQAYWLISGFLI